MTALVLALLLPGAALAQDQPARGRGKGWAFDDMPGDQEIPIRLLEAKAESARARPAGLLDRSTGVVVSEMSYTWTGRLTASWLHVKAATDIPASLEAFVGVCRPTS